MEIKLKAIRKFPKGYRMIVLYGDFRCGWVIIFKPKKETEQMVYFPSGWWPAIKRYVKKCGFKWYAKRGEWCAVRGEEFVGKVDGKQSQEEAERLFPIYLKKQNLWISIFDEKTREIFDIRRRERVCEDT